MRSPSSESQSSQGSLHRPCVAARDTHRAARLRRGFTLVEILVVIAIIGILAALITPAIYSAMWSARQSRIKTELDQLAAGIEAFKAKYGSYPPANLTCPSNAANAYLQAFVAKAFPRYTLTTASTLGQQIYNDLTANGVDTTNLNPQAALTFWLLGQSPDVTDPFNRTLSSVTRVPFFTFDSTRLLVAGTTTPANLSANSKIGGVVYNAPYGNTAYAYLDYQSYGVAPTSLPAQYTSVSSTIGPIFMTTSSSNNSLLGTNTSMIVSNGTGYFTPYFADTNGNAQIDSGETFARPTSYQIISAGQDGSFGTTNSTKATYFRLFATGTGYDTAGGDDDNITNFNEKNSLDAAKP